MRLLLALILGLVLAESVSGQLVVQQQVKPVVLPSSVLPYQYRILPNQSNRRLTQEELIDQIAIRVVEMMEARERGEALTLDPDFLKVQQTVTASCLKCHQADSDSGVDLTNLAALDPESARRVVASVYEGTMPKNADPLPDEAVSAFVRWQLKRINPQ